MITAGGEITLINLTNQEIKFYLSDVVDIPTNPVKKKDLEKFLARCISVPSVGHCKCEIHRDSDHYKVTLKNSPKKLALSFSNIGNASELPNEQDNNIIIVSQLVFNAIHNIRKDVYMVDKPIRDESGKVIACRSLSRCVYDLQIIELTPIRQFLQEEIAQSTGEGKEARLEKLIKLNKILSNFISKD